jgi:acyl-CoA thioesterase FadM
MKYIFRLLWLVLTHRRRSRCSIIGPCVSGFRVWPNDLDVFLHMNNGVYLTVADLARTDLMLRSDTFGPIRQRGWYPVVTGAAVRFRRSLKLWQRYTITTRILGWDERSFYIQQVFESRGELVNEIWLEGRFLARSGPKPSIAEVLALAGHTGPSPALEPEVSDWLGALHAERIAPAP